MKDDDQDLIRMLDEAVEALTTPEAIERQKWNSVVSALKEDDLKKLQEFSKEDFQIRDEKGKNYLAYARSKEAVDFLVGQGLDVNATDKDGRTPLFDAIFNGKGEPYGIIKALIDHGAKNVKDNEGRTAKDFALSFYGRESSGFLIGKLFEEKENNEKIKDQLRTKICKMKKKVSGTVINDEIAQKVISGEETRPITPKVGKELSEKLIKQRKLKTH